MARQWLPLAAIISFAAFGLSGRVALATDYYVDGGATVANDSNAGTLAAPLKTIIKGAQKASAAGDHVYVNPGDGTSASGYVYRGAIAPTASGVSGNLILYRGDGLDVNGASINWTSNAGAKSPSVSKAVVNGNATDLSGFNITGSYVKVQYFEITNTKDNNAAPYGDGIYLNGSVGSVLDNCYVHDTGGNHSSAVDVESHSNSVTVSNCTLGNASDATAQPPNSGGIYVGSGTNIAISNCTIAKILNNGNFPQGIIYVNDSGATISSCVIHDNTTTPTAANIDGAMVFFASSGNSGTVTSTSIYSNTVNASGNNAIGAGIYSKGSPTTITSCQIYNNSLTSNTTFASSAIYLDTGATSATANYNLIYGNTNSIGGSNCDGIRDADTGGVIIGNTVECPSNGNVIALIIGGTGSAATVRNNIAIADNASNYAFDVLKTVSSSNYNLFWNSTGSGGNAVSYNGTNYTNAQFATYQSAKSQDQQSVNANPNFVTSGSDYHLKSTFGHWNGSGWTLDNVDSPAIDAGTPATPVMTAFTASGSTSPTARSTRGFPASGTAYVSTTAGGNKSTFTYTGIKATSFTGVAWTGGSGLAHTTSERVYVDDPASASTPSSIANWDNETGDNGYCRDIGYYGNTSSASLSGVQGASVTWIGGNTKTWTFTNAGETSTTTGWNNPANWSSAAVPTSADSVWVPQRANNPTVDASGSCNSLEVSNASNNSPAQTAGSLTMNSATSYTLTAAGNVTIDSGCTLTMSNASQTLSVAGNWDDSAASGGFVATGGTVNFTGTGTIALRTAATANNFYGLQVSGGTRTPATNANASGALQVNGSLTVSGGTLDLSGTHTLTMGNASPSITGGGTLGSSSGTGTISASSTVTISTSSGTLTIGLSGGSMSFAGASGAVTVSSGNVTLASNVTVNGALTVNAGTFDLGTNQLTLASTSSAQSIATGATLNMAASASAAPTLYFGAAGTLKVNGKFNSTPNGANTPTVSGAAGDTNLQLLGATVNITGMNYSNGAAGGLTIGQNGATDSTVTSFKGVAFTNTTSGGRHLYYKATGGISMVAVGCSFDSSFGTGKAVKCDTSSATPPYAVCVCARSAGAGINSTDTTGTGKVTWTYGGDQITTTPGTGESTTGDTVASPAPLSYNGVQGFMTSQYNWFTGSFTDSYLLSRDSSGTDKLLAIGSTGQITGTYSINEATYGKVIGPPWTATLGSTSPGTAEVVMFVTTGGYIFVVQDSSGTLSNYTGFPVQPRSSGSYATVVTQAAYSPLLFDAGADGVANGTGDTDDFFYFTGCSVAPGAATYNNQGGSTNQVLKTKCFASGAQGQCVSGFPVLYGAKAAWNWPALETLSGTTYLHIATDCDVYSGELATNQGHIIRINASTGAIDQNYVSNLNNSSLNLVPNYSRPRNHSRGGMQIVTDFVNPNFNRMYLGAYHDAVAVGPDYSKFFSINTNSTSPATYNDQWAPWGDTTGNDIDSMATFGSTQIFFGDSGGLLHSISNTTGLETAGWPMTLDAGKAIRCAAVFPTAGSSNLYIGNDYGEVFEVNTNTHTLVNTFYLGDGQPGSVTRRVRTLSVYIDNSNNTYVGAITSDGYEFLLGPF